MLQNLHIKNVVLIEEIDISFQEGLNILTGETGAGKSILIGSLSVGLGGKFQKEMLRDTEQDGLVELLFSMQSEQITESLKQMGISVGGDGELLISRRLFSSGRTVNRVNDCTVTTAKLQEIAALLIDLHAQHEQQTLLKADKHLEILDRYGGEVIAKQKDEVRTLYAEYVQMRDALHAGTMDEIDKQKRMDFLQYQINEIRSAALVPGEEEELEGRYRVYEHAKEIIEAASDVYQSTGYDNGQSAGELLGHAVGRLGRVTEYDASLDALYAMLQDIDGMVNEFNRELKRYMDNMSFDERVFAEMTERLDLIHNLQAKYGKTVSDILESCRKFEEEYHLLLSHDEYMCELREKLKKQEQALAKACDSLHSYRFSYAKQLCASIRSALGELNFSSVEFDMQFEALPHFTANGTDRAYFMISANVGERMRPLYEAASGGELSRVMLAVKSCLAREDAIPTLLFDEIDVGISGKTAWSVAGRLAVIAKHHQVLCITHLPQIAAMADYHYQIEKFVENEKTITKIKKLDAEASIDEIARLLGGAVITKNTILSAREMKELADGTKKH